MPLRGAGVVAVIGAPPARLDLARELGVDVTLHLDDPPASRADAVAGLTDGRGADVVIEASGNPHLQVNRKHATVMGQWGTDFRHIVRGLRVTARHGVPFRRIIGARYGLDDAQRALDDVAALRVTKAIIDPSLDAR